MTLSRALWKTSPSYKHNNWNYNLQDRRVFAIQYYLDKKEISIMTYEIMRSGWNVSAFGTTQLKDQYFELFRIVRKISPLVFFLLK